jgi:hypothetical protein
LDDKDDNGLLPLRSCPVFSCVKLISLSCVVAGIMKVASIRILILANLVAFSHGSAMAIAPAPAPKVPNPNFVPGEVAAQLVTDALNALTSVNRDNTGGVLVNSGSVSLPMVTNSVGGANTATAATATGSFIASFSGVADASVNTVATGAAGIFAFP